MSTKSANVFRLAMLVLLTANGLVACAPGADALTRVLPDERILINLPTEGASAKDGDRAWSEYYLFTAQVTDDVNGLIGGVLGTVHAVAQSRPTWLDDTHAAAMWGPYADALDPAEVRLYVTYDGETDTHAWSVTMKAKNDEAAVEVPVIEGLVDPGASEDDSSGAFHIDFSAVSELNPNERASGIFSSTYDVDPEGVAATATFDGFTEGGDVVDAVYAYDQIHGGEGSMDLGWIANIDTGAEENFSMHARWLADGQGRGDARVTGGDLGEAVATASECWDDLFAPVFRAESWSGLVEGDAALCAYADAVYSEAAPE